MEHLLSHLLDPARLHPAIVHFPIALLVLSVFFDLLSLITRRDDFRNTAFHLLIVGVLSAVAAIGAGLMAADSAMPPEDLLNTHARLAVGAVGVFLALLGWRVMARNRFSSGAFSLYLTGGIAGAVMILAAAFWGGHMVYEEGVGIKKSLLHRFHEEMKQEQALPEPSLGDESSGHDHDSHDHGSHDH